MRRPVRTLLVSPLLLAALAALPLAGCSDTAKTIPPRPTATFVPDADPPPAGSVTLQPGAVDGYSFDVRVSVTGIDDLFGAAFWISFDEKKLAFVSADDSGSLLAEGGAEVTCLVEAISEAGTVKIGISRVQDLDGTVPGVNVTEPADLLVIRLFAASSAAGVAIDFVDGSLELRDSSQPPPGEILEATWAGGSVTVN